MKPNNDAKIWPKKLTFMNGKAIEYFTACTLGPDLFARNCIQRIGFAVFRTEKVVVIGENNSWKAKWCNNLCNDKSLTEFGNSHKFLS